MWIRNTYKYAKKKFRTGKLVGFDRCVGEKWHVLTLASVGPSSRPRPPPPTHTLSQLCPFRPLLALRKLLTLLSVTTQTGKSPPLKGGESNEEINDTVTKINSMLPYKYCKCWETQWGDLVEVFKWTKEIKRISKRHWTVFKKKSRI